MPGNWDSVKGGTATYVIDRARALFLLDGYCFLPERVPTFTNPVPAQLKVIVSRHVASIHIADVELRM